MTTDPDSNMQVERPRRSVARNALALMASQSFTWVLATIVAWTVPRYLGATALGQWRLATSVAAIVVVLAAFGTNTLLTVEVAKARTSVRSLTKSVLRVRVVAYVVVIPLVAIFLVAGSYDLETSRVVLIMSGGAVIALVTSALLASLHGLQEMGTSSITTVIAKTLNAAGTLLVLAVGGRVLELSVVTVAVAGVGLLITYVGFRRVLPFRRDPPPLVGRALLATSVPFFLADASLVLYQQVDTVVMSLLLAEEAIGWYAAADTLFGSSLFVPVIVLTAMFPAIAELHATSPEQVPRLLTQSFNRLLIIAVPIGVGTIVVSRSFIATLYGPEYAPSAQVLAVFGVVTILTCQTILLGGFALATGRAGLWTGLMIVAIVVSIPVDLVLVPWTADRFDNGAIGGALAYIVTELFLIIAGIAMIAPQLVSRQTAARTARCLAAGGVMLAVGLPLGDRSFLISGTVSLIAYVIALVVTRTLDDDDRALVAAAVRKVRSRLQ